MMIKCTKKLIQCIFLWRNMTDIKHTLTCTNKGL